MKENQTLTLCHHWPGKFTVSFQAEMIHLVMASRIGYWKPNLWRKLHYETLSLWWPPVAHLYNSSFTHTVLPQVQNPTRLNPLPLLWLNVFYASWFHSPKASQWSMAVGTACQWNSARLKSAAIGSLHRAIPDGAGKKCGLQHVNCKAPPGQLTPDIASYQSMDSCTKADLENETELMCFESCFIKSSRERAREIEINDYFFYRREQASIRMTYNSH